MVILSLKIGTCIYKQFLFACGNECFIVDRERLDLLGGSRCCRLGTESSGRGHQVLNGEENYGKTYL